MALLIIRAYAQDNGINGCVLFYCVAKLARFFRSARGIVFRIEVDDDILPPEIG